MTLWVTGRFRPLMAAFPVLVLLELLASGKVGRVASGSVWAGDRLRDRGLRLHMPPGMIPASVGVGLIFAMFRIVWLIIAAVFLYRHRSGHRAVRRDEGVDRPTVR